VCSRSTSECEVAIQAVQRTTILALLILALGCGSSADTWVALEPTPLRAVPENQLIRWPSIVFMADTAFIVANLFPIRGDSLDATPTYLGRRVQHAGQPAHALPPIALPAGPFQIAYPHLIVADGALHMVWVEFKTPPRTTASWLSARSVSLWHAVRTNGAWSEPEQIANGMWLGWNDRAGGVAVDGTGQLHIAVWIADTIPGVRHVHQVNGRWVSTRLGYSSLNQSSAILGKADTLTIAAIDDGSGFERIAIAQSSDQGKAWTSRLVGRPRAGATVGGLALAADRQAVTLAVAEQKLDNFAIDTLRLMSLLPSAAESPERVIVPPVNSSSFRFAIAPCGVGVLLFATLSLNPRVYELELNGGAAPRAEVKALLSDSTLTGFPGVAAGSRGAVAAFAFKGGAAGPAISAAMTLVSCAN
jgi:hypothetical protein